MNSPIAAYVWSPARTVRISTVVISIPISVISIVSVITVPTIRIVPAPTWSSPRIPRIVPRVIAVVPRIVRTSVVVVVPCIAPATSFAHVGISHVPRLRRIFRFQGSVDGTVRNRFRLVPTRVVFIITWKPERWVGVYVENVFYCGSGGDRRAGEKSGERVEDIVVSHLKTDLGWRNWLQAKCFGLVIMQNEILREIERTYIERSSERWISFIRVVLTII